MKRILLALLVIAVLGGVLAKKFLILDDETPGLTAFMVVAMVGRTDVARQLVADGADVNATDAYGGTALMLAAYYGHPAVARLLIEQGADVNAVSKDGHSARMLAAKGGHSSIVQMLRAAGAK